MRVPSILAALAIALALPTLAAAAETPAQLPAVASDLAAEATAKLQALVRIDTTNPPGGEVQAATLIGDWLRAEGVTPAYYESAPGRTSVLARLKGRGDKAPLLLLNHLDVVTVEPKSWRFAPFSGEIAEGALWGRGSLDMKSLGVMELLAFLELKRKGVPLSRDVIFCATPDEEAGGTYGAAWLLEHHPDVVNCAEVLNEGGAGTILPNGAKMMGIQIAERGICWLRLTASGNPGHGSIDRPDAASRRLVRALARLESASRPLEIVPEAKSLFGAIGDTETGLRSWVLHNIDNPLLMPFVLPQVIAQQPTLAPMLGTTMNITVLKAGEKVNVIPGTASAEVDIRMLPGHTVSETVAWVRQLLSDPGITVEVIHGRDGSRSPAGGPLFDALRAAAQAEYPGVGVVGVLTPGGGTDSAFFRAAGAHCYGLLPIIASTEQLASMHGNNERITLEQIAAGTRVVVKAVEAASRQVP